jgi:hypothetical protein
LASGSKTGRQFCFGLLLLGAWAVHFLFVWNLAPLLLLLIRIVLIVLSLFWVLAWRGALRTR